MKAAVASALNAGEMMAVHWLVWNDAELPSHFDGDICFHEVAGQGRLDVLQWLDEEGKLDGAVTLLETAAENGHLEVVHWLVEKDRDGELMKLGGEGSMSIHPAAINGNLAVAKYLCANVQRPTSTAEHELEVERQRDTYTALEEQLLSKAATVSGKTMAEAAKNGHLHVVQGLYAEFGEDPFINLFNYSEVWKTSVDTVAMDAAANNGHLDVLKYLHELEKADKMQSKKRKREEMIKKSTPTCTVAAMDGAAANGHLDVVKWLHENRSEGCTTRAVDAAASGGHLNIVQWLFENRSEGCTSAAMDGAAGNGHLEVVQWLHSNTQAGCTTLAMDGAAQNGHLEVVKWLHEYRSEGCTANAMDKAAEKGFLDVVKWLHSNRKGGCTKQIADIAACNNQLRVLWWLRSHGLESFPITCIDSAARNGHFEMLLYLHSKCNLKCTEDALSWAFEWTPPEPIDWIREKYPVFLTGEHD